MDEHITDHALALATRKPETLTPDQRFHLGACEVCRETFDFLVALQSDEEEETEDSLFALGAQVRREDEEAERLLAHFLAHPARVAWQDLASQRRYVHGGVARRLALAAHEICASKPRHALIFADAAIEIADALPDDVYVGKAIFDVRGTACKERANALIRLGDIPGAFRALTRAEASFQQLRSPAFGLASVALVRAAAYYQQQSLDEALAYAEQAADAYGHLSDTVRRMDALYLRGEIFFERQEYDRAADIFRSIIDYGEGIGDAQWVAKGSYCLGSALLELGDITAASMLFHRAIATFRETGPESDRISTEWGIALVLLRAGKWTDAHRRLTAISAEFARLGMVTDAALAGLDGVEALVALGRHRAVVDLATHIFSIFTSAGMLTSALTAVAYIKDAAAAGRITREDVRDVRAFVRKAERHPDLLFVPPSDRLS